MVDEILAHLNKSPFELIAGSYFPRIYPPGYVHIFPTSQHFGYLVYLEDIVPGSIGDSNEA